LLQLDAFRQHLVAMISAVVGVTGLLLAPSQPMTSVSPRAGAVAMSGGGGGPIPNKNVWVTFADASDCKPGTVVSGFQYGQEIAIATADNGRSYALSNKLPPTGQPATLGNIDGSAIIEPVSATAFNLGTGKVDGEWCPSPIGRLIFGRLVPKQDAITFPLRKTGSKVQVLINVNAKKQFESNYWRGILDAQGKTDGGYY